MGMPLQMKLLRVLQEREFERVGDSSTIKVDVRVIAATNADLTQMVGEGLFRGDLFYRLNVIPVKLPPLRDRKEDIPLLVQHFLQKFCVELGRPAMTMSQTATRCLMAYGWPGNIRQLENAVERAVALSGGRSQIEAIDLPPEIQQASDEPPPPSAIPLPEDGIDFEKFIADIEREMIRRSLERTERQQGRGRPSPQPEANDAGREVETAGTELTMPPRYTYWTIIVDGMPTAFRAAEREELLPTFERIRQKNPGAELKWFANGRLWGSPEEARRAERPPRHGRSRPRLASRRAAQRSARSVQAEEARAPAE